MTTIDFGAFEALTFDCYGTLIDWETGILAALRPVLLAHGVAGASVSDDALLERFGAHESAVEAGPYRRYREVLGEVLGRLGSDLGFVPAAGESAAFGASVGEWPPFPDSSAALASLQRRLRLGVITNCDDDLFAASAERLGIAFDWVVTAQQVHAYKPNLRNFEVAFGVLGLPRDRILHVAQSLFHDHVPAKALGLTTVWVDRRGGRPGGGATPPAPDVAPDLTVPDMATLASLAAG
jgi:2-haloacid dehalogenase